MAVRMHGRTAQSFDTCCGELDMTTRPPVPPFSLESATQKVRLAEDSWNSRDPERVSQGYALDSRWRNRSEFVNGRQYILSYEFSARIVKFSVFDACSTLGAFFCLVGIVAACMGKGLGVRLLIPLGCSFGMLFWYLTIGPHT